MKFSSCCEIYVRDAEIFFFSLLPLGKAECQLLHRLKRLKRSNFIKATANSRQ